MPYWRTPKGANQLRGCSPRRQPCFAKASSLKEIAFSYLWPQHCSLNALLDILRTPFCNALIEVWIEKVKWDIRYIGVREIFCQGGGGKPFAQKILASVPNFYKRVEKKRGPYCNNIGRTGVWRWLDTVFQGQCQDHSRSTFVLIRVAMISELSWHRNHAVTYFTSAKSKILGTGNLTKSFTGAFFANTVFSMFAKFRLNL